MQQFLKAQNTRDLLQSQRGSHHLQGYRITCQVLQREEIAVAFPPQHLLQLVKSFVRNLGFTLLERPVHGRTAYNCVTAAVAANSRTFSAVAAATAATNTCNEERALAAYAAAGALGHDCAGAGAASCPDTGHMTAVTAAAIAA